MATNIGVGCTTISILLANTLAHEGKRAAIVELDDADGCFEQLCRQEREEEQVDGITKFAIGTLDYYYHVPLQKFQLDYKPYMILLSMIWVSGPGNDLSCVCEDAKPLHCNIKGRMETA